MGSNGHYDDDGSFIKVAENEDSDDFVELPAEGDDTLILSTLQGQFPSAVGLRYKSSSGGWRGVRIAGDALNPPHGGWGDTTYYITLAKALSGVKRKTEESLKEEHPSKSSRNDDVKSSDKHLLQDMIVLGLPFNCKDSDLRDYFTSACGEMSLHEVKYDRNTGKPRGFGFIRFKSVEGANAALSGEHSLIGRKVEIRLSKRKEEPMKLFVGRIPDGTSPAELKEYFSDFGEVKDAYIPQPGRGFGFVTYESSEDGRAALRREHKMGDSRLNVQYAEPKEEKMARRRREEERLMDENRGTGYGGRDEGYYSRDSRDRGLRDTRETRGTRDTSDYKDRHDNDSRYDSRSYQGDYGDQTSQLKSMLYTLLGGGHY